MGLAAPTGKAAARLRQSIQKALSGLREQLGPDALPPSLSGPATTLHSLLGTVPGTRRFRHDATHPLPLDVLFVLCTTWPEAAYGSLRRRPPRREAP